MDKRGYRKAVRVIITDGRHILLGRKIINGKFVCYEFPGGGVEEGDSLEETVVKECLEEVGILVTDAKSLNMAVRWEIDFPNPERAKLYRGGEDNWFTAKKVKQDKSLHGIEGDLLPHEWVTIETAISKIKNGPESIYNEPRIEALTKVALMNGLKSTRW